VLSAAEKVKKKIPQFRNEDEEFEFWSKVDSTEYLDWSQAARVPLPNLERTSRISGALKSSSS
jgi:hypothetical protein